MMPTFKYIDIFAGCGGLSTGLHLAGWKGLFAENNASAFSTLKANLLKSGSTLTGRHGCPRRIGIFGDLVQKAAVLKKLQGSVDLVVGGPPCQGFSTAGRRHEDDERNTLVHSYLRLVEMVQPRAILFENVRGFTMKFKANADAGVTYSQLVIENLRELGYEDARGELIDMSDYGVPQRRQRFIVIATREGLADAAFKALKVGARPICRTGESPERMG